MWHWCIIGKYKLLCSGILHRPVYFSHFLVLKTLLFRIMWTSYWVNSICHPESCSLTMATREPCVNMGRIYYSCDCSGSSFRNNWNVIVNWVCVPSDRTMEMLDWMLYDIMRKMFSFKKLYVVPESAMALSF